MLNTDTNTYKMNRYLDIDIYQANNKWSVYVSLKREILKREINDYWNFDEFLEACKFHVGPYFESRKFHEESYFKKIDKNMDLLKTIYETIKEDLYNEA